MGTFIFTEQIVDFLGDFFLRGSFEMSLLSIFIAEEENKKTMTSLLALFEALNLENYSSILDNVDLSLANDKVKRNVNTLASIIYTKVTPKDMVFKNHQCVKEFIKKALEFEKRIQMNSNWSLWLYNCLFY